MKLYNYTAIKQKETKIYDIGGYKMSSGLSVDFLKIFLPFVGASLLIGFLFSYFRPKKTYSTSFKTKQINLHNYKIKGFVKNIL